MEYSNLEPISRAEYRRLIGEASRANAAEAVLRLALHEEESKWAEGECVTHLTDARLEVRMAAATGLAHLARRQRGLEPSTISYLASLRSDPEIGGTVEDALDDVVVFSQPQSDS